MQEPNGVRLSPIITIDDLHNIAQLLVNGLRKLGEYQYPLAIRRGVKNMKERKPGSETIKAGAITYFFDIKETKDGNPYLLITESRFKGEGEDRERKTIFVFQEQAAEFSKTVNEMVAKIVE